MFKTLKHPKQHLAAATWLQDNLGQTFDAALKSTFKYPLIVKNSIDELNTIYKLFINNNFQNETLSNHPWVFTIKEKLIKYKLEENNIHIVTKDDIPLITFSKYHYQRVINKWKIDDAKYLGPNLNRIDYFSQNLNSKPQDILNIMYHHPHIMSLEINKLISVMNILKEANVEEKKILADMHIFRINDRLILERVKQCQTLGVPIKMWPLWCPALTYKKYLDKNVEEYQALGNHKDKFEFLESELEVSKECIKQSLAHRSAKYYRKIIDLLKSNGFTSKEISLNIIKLLDLSPATIEERIETLQKLGVKLTLADIIKSDAYFKVFIKYCQENNGDASTLK